MEARVARFKKLQSYQRQNLDAHGIPPGAMEKITARKVFPVMAPADYQGRSAGAPDTRSTSPGRNSTTASCPTRSMPRT